jgi:hypothetical protein
MNNELSVYDNIFFLLFFLMKNKISNSQIDLAMLFMQFTTDNGYGMYKNVC